MHPLNSAKCECGVRGNLRTLYSNSALNTRARCFGCTPVFQTGGTGSIPVSRSFPFVTQWLACFLHMEEVGGSNPPERTITVRSVSAECTDTLRSAEATNYLFLSWRNWRARGSHKAEVGGSSPPERTMTVWSVSVECKFM